MTYVKAWLRDLLRRYGRQILYLPRGAVSGTDFVHDLKVVIPCDAPVCLDVGANEGQTIRLFRRTWRDPRIHAFEPSRKTFRVLECQQLDVRVSLHNYALGRCMSRRELIQYDSSDLSSFLALDEDRENRFRDVRIDSTEVVDVKTVDWFLRDAELTAIDLLKVDTQGTDLEVLLGSQEALRAGLIANILVELNFVRMYKDQSSALDILDFLGKHHMHLVDFYEKVYQANTLAWCTALFRRGSANGPCVPS